MKNLFEVLIKLLDRLLVYVFSFSLKKKRPPISKDRPPIWGHIQYTRDVLKGERFEIGEYTYGTPQVLGNFPWHQHKLKIGRFCSIADGVKIFLAGNHRIDLVSTYPFGAFPDDWPESRSVQIPKGVGSSIIGDVVIGNDVWIGGEAIILSEVKIGDGCYNRCSGCCDEGC